MPSDRTHSMGEHTYAADISIGSILSYNQVGFSDTVYMANAWHKVTTYTLHFSTLAYLSLSCINGKCSILL